MRILLLILIFFIYGINIKGYSQIFNRYEVKNVNSEVIESDNLIITNLTIYGRKYSRYTIYFPQIDYYSYDINPGHNTVKIDLVKHGKEININYDGLVIRVEQEVRNLELEFGYDFYGFLTSKFNISDETGFQDTTVVEKKFYINDFYVGPSFKVDRYSKLNLFLQYRNTDNDSFYFKQFLLSLYYTNVIDPAGWELSLGLLDLGYHINKNYVTGISDNNFAYSSIFSNLIVSSNFSIFSTHNTISYLKMKIGILDYLPTIEFNTSKPIILFHNYKPSLYYGIGFTFKIGF